MFKSPDLSLFFLCAHHPVNGRPFGVGRLLLKELPGLLVLAEDFLVSRRKFARSILKRIDTRAFWITPGVRLESGRLHSSFFLESLDVSNVNEAPDAPWLSRRETNCVTRLVQVPAYSIDPAETESLVQGFRVSDALLS